MVLHLYQPFLDCAETLLLSHKRTLVEEKKTMNNKNKRKSENLHNYRCRLGFPGLRTTYQKPLFFTEIGENVYYTFFLKPAINKIFSEIYDIFLNFFFVFQLFQTKIILSVEKYCPKTIE